VQRSLLDDLGKAIDRLMARCQMLDTDRTKLAHALARVQEELVRERAAHADSKECCALLRARQEEAAKRLENLLAAVAAASPSLKETLIAAAPDLQIQETRAADEVALKVPPQEQKEKEEAVLPLEARIKPVDWTGTLERISGLAADAVGEPRSGPKDAEKSAAPKEETEVVAVYQDRLF